MKSGYDILSHSDYQNVFVWALKPYEFNWYYYKEPKSAFIADLGSFKCNFSLILHFVFVYYIKHGIAYYHVITHLLYSANSAVNMLNY